MRLISFLSVVFLLSTATAQTVTSPDGQLAATFQTVTRAAASPGQPSAGLQPSPQGQLVYRVTFHGQELLEPSALRLELKDQPVLGAAVRIANSSTSTIDETYRLPHGKTSTARNHCHVLRLELEETAAPARKFTVEARAYNDAIAFRYIVPAQPGLSEYVLTREATEFRIAKDPITYALVLPNYRSMYESEFLKLPASAFSNQGGVKSSSLIGLPLLMEVPGVAWAAITEADMHGNAAMYLENPSGSWSGHYFESRLAPQVEDPTVAVRSTLPHNSPWRIIMAGTEPGRLIESTVITNLNPPPAISDISWIHPGKASWDWWNGSQGRDGKSAFTTETMKYYVDFSADSGFPYMLVDAGWSSLDNITKINGRVDVPELVKYAAPKKVKIWLWLHYRGVVKQMEEAFALYEKWGVAGMKIDFIERDDQAGIDFYYKVAECAARHHLMVDFHGSTKPTGMERTWPNVMGYEAVLGMEQSKAGARDNPDNHVTLPFTRMLTGLMDYTPGGFENATKAGFLPRGRAPMVMGTRAHHLAMYAIYDAPVQMVADSPAAYKDQPSFQFIKSVPAAWDESKVLAGSPGEFIVMARRHGNEWFLGAMTNWTQREVEIPLSFLPAGAFTAEIYADAADSATLPKNISIRKQAVDRAKTLKLTMAPGGGYAARLAPSKP
ncbi:MAG: glycoside hydrolase family 97 protein [Acidobacteria bacterium]|nr:glycoside hydrolase family 97 protein [Acidobacteriota bacterium]